MSKRVSQKMGVREGARAFFLDAPESALAAIELPALVVAGDVGGNLDYIHLFATTQARLGEAFPKLKERLGSGGTLWVSWPKNKGLGTDLSLPVVIRIGYSHGLVESTCLSIDATWSALKFTHPKPGKTYRNSYGQLPS